MGEVIRQSELRNNNAEIMRRVAEGESFTVTVHGHRVADLVPHQHSGARRHFVPAAELDRVIADAGPDPDAELWAQDMAHAAELFDDDASLDPWERARTR